MTPAELLARATEFDAGVMPIVNGYFLADDPDADREEHHRIRIVRRYNARTKEVKWAITDGPYHLNTSGKWEYASRSNRAYLRRCRYNSAEEAFDHYHRWKQAVCEWARKKLAKAKPGERVTLNLPKRGIKIKKSTRIADEILSSLEELAEKLGAK